MGSFVIIAHPHITGIMNQAHVAMGVMAGKAPGGGCRRDDVAHVDFRQGLRAIRYDGLTQRIRRKPT